MSGEAELFYRLRWRQTTWVTKILIYKSRFNKKIHKFLVISKPERPKRNFIQCEVAYTCHNFLLNHHCHLSGYTGHLAQKDLSVLTLTPIKLMFVIPVWVDTVESTYAVITLHVLPEKCIRSRPYGLWTFQIT